MTRKTFTPLIPIFLLIFLDQAAKAWAFINIATVCNTGIAFGIGQGWGDWITALVLAVLFFVIIKGSGPRESRTLNSLGLVLVLAGGVSNVIDRFARGCVVDFVSFYSLPRLTWLIS